MVLVDMLCLVLVYASCSPSDHDVAFQSCRTLQGTGAALAFALSSGPVCITAKLYIVIIILIVSIIFYAVFEYRLRRSAAEAGPNGADVHLRRQSGDVRHGCDFTWFTSTSEHRIQTRLTFAVLNRNRHMWHNRSKFQCVLTSKHPRSLAPSYFFRTRFSDSPTLSPVTSAEDISRIITRKLWKREQIDTIRGR